MTSSASSPTEEPPCPAATSTTIDPRNDDRYDDERAAPRRDDRDYDDRGRDDRDQGYDDYEEQPRRGKREAARGSACPCPRFS